MAKKILTIEVGSQQTRVCEMDYATKNPHVYKTLTFDTPEGAVEDGFINDTSRFAVAMRDALDRERVTTKDVVFTISSSKIANREVTIPMVKDSKIMQVVQASASEYFPVDISDYVISYTVQQRINTKTDKQLVLLLLAAPNDLIRRYYHLARDMRFHVTSIDYSGNSLFQIVRRQVRKGVNMCLQINEQSTLINIIEDDKLILQRVIPYGTSTLIETVRDHQVFGADTDRAAFDLLRTEKLLNMHFNEGNSSSAGMMENASDSYNRAMQQQMGIEDITESLSYLVNNFNRVLDYYNSRNADKRIREVVLAGPGATVLGMEDLLRNETGMEIRRLQSLFGLVFPKKSGMSEMDQMLYLTCFGAVFQPVGFEVKEITTGGPVRDGSSAPYALGLAGVVVLGVAAYALTFFLCRSAQNEQDVVSREIEDLQTVEQVYAEHDRVQKVSESVDGMYTMTESTADLLNDLWRAMNTIMPKNTVVGTMSIAEDGGINFAVTSTNELLSVPYLITQLESEIKSENGGVQMITDVEVNSVARDVENGRNVVHTYSVSCRFTDTVLAEIAAAGTNNGQTNEDAVAGGETNE